MALHMTGRKRLPHMVSRETQLANELVAGQSVYARNNADYEEQVVEDLVIQITETFRSVLIHHFKAGATKRIEKATAWSVKYGH